MIVRICDNKFGKYDWIAFLYIFFIMGLYCIVWNNSLCEWTIPNKTPIILGEMIVSFMLAILFAICWFFVIGGLCGIFFVFDWCDRKK